jgi:hypothetical protein
MRALLLGVERLALARMGELLLKLGEKPLQGQRKSHGHLLQTVLQLPEARRTRLRTAMLQMSRILPQLRELMLLVRFLLQHGIPPKRKVRRHSEHRGLHSEQN